MSIHLSGFFILSFFAELAGENLLNHFLLDFSLIMAAKIQKVIGYRVTILY